MNFLKLDSPLMKFLGRMADLMIVNILTVLLCIPVITAGASFTAMHYVLLKLSRNEEGYLVRSFFKSFKQNFVQATILWIIMANVAVVLYVDWRYILTLQGQTQFTFKVLFALLVLLISLGLVYIFPLLSRYQNTVGGTIKQAFRIAYSGFPAMLRAFAGAALALSPLFFAWYTTFKLIPILAVFCFSVPGYFRALLYSGIFKKLEGGDKPSSEEDPS
ncbi:MAG: YesL family protein [Lachnospiraceae bacterium]|nr:YesL family protein [Lachnospiraceae bacterium]